MKTNQPSKLMMAPNAVSLGEPTRENPEPSETVRSDCKIGARNDHGSSEERRRSKTLARNCPSLSARSNYALERSVKG